MSTFSNIKLIAFDADDTLWDCQSYFEKVEKEYCEILSKWGNSQEISEALFQTETKNMDLLGYGCKAFTISLIENAVKLSHGDINGNDIQKIIELSKTLLKLPSTPLPEVEKTLHEIRRMDKYDLVIFTKGEILDQQNKIKRSGLEKYFDDVVIVSDKTREKYVKLCREHDTEINNLLMIGNSFKSDIKPVLQLGGYAVHIPFHVEWKHEVTDEYDHHHLIRLQQFCQLTEIL